MDFKPFPKISRFNRDVVVTEKIDGTNASITITEDGQFLTASRTRYITPQDDNYGFSQWAHEHKADLLTLGVGTHFGEWWGQGIQRNYGLNHKRFSLFNVKRWDPTTLPHCCHVVPILKVTTFEALNVKEIMENLKASGSMACPGYNNPEGIVIYHTASNTLFKKTFLKDDKGKWEEDQ